MRINNFTPPRSGQIIFFLCIVALTVSIVQGCEKLDIKSKESTTAIADNSSFYKNIEKASTPMKRIADEFKKREGHSLGYISRFMEKHGNPLWLQGFKINKSDLSRGEGEDSVFIIPVIHYNDTTVKTFIKAMLLGSDSVEIDTYTESDYSRLPFCITADSLQDAEKLAIKFMFLTNIVFGVDSFRIMDKRLFHGSANYTDTASISRWVKLEVSDSTATGRIGSNTSNFMYHQLCVTVTTQIGTGQHCGTPDNASCIPRCDNCGDFCWQVGIYQSSTYCTGWWEEDGGSGGGSSGGTTGAGTGGSAPQGGGGGWVPVSSPQNPSGSAVSSDSLVIEMLKKQMKNIKKQRDSVWTLAHTNNWEYFFYLKKDADSVKAVGIKTDHEEHFVKPDRASIGITVPEGDYHTHQDNAAIDRHQHDPQDIRAGNMQYRNKLNFSSWVDCGDTVYVLVTQNKTAFDNFIKTKNIDVEMNNFFANVAGSSNRRQKGLQKLLELIGTVSISGLGLYKTTDSNFNNFVKIN